MATAKNTLQEGDTFVLTALEGHGTGIGAVPTGTEVLVDLVHTKPVAGVGGVEGVLFSWVSSTGPRSAHLPRADFARLFKKAGK